MADRIPVPVDAQAYLARKTVVETDAWNELQWGEHAHAFTVAHSRGAGVLADIFGLLSTAMADGQAYETFAASMRQLMADKGWYGRSDKSSGDEQYIAWRTRLMYDINMRTAYEAGRYRQQLRGAALRPIWLYVSKLFGKNRRQDHIALHGKAVRYDDPFWDTFRPPNGWGCECTIESLSEQQAADQGIEVVAMGADGSLPTVIGADGQPVDWGSFAPEEWRYNVGREALAPNFRSYQGLDQIQMPDGRSALSHVADRYRHAMDGVCMSDGEFVTLCRKAAQKDYTPAHINYQVGNVTEDIFTTLRAVGITDSKIMATDKALYHGIAQKNIAQAIPNRLLSTLYTTLQEPEHIYVERNPPPRRKGEALHFVTIVDGKALVAIMRYRGSSTALQITTLAYKGNDYDDEVTYKKLR